MKPPAADARHPQPARAGVRGALAAALLRAAALAMFGRREDLLGGLPEDQAARVRAAQVGSVVGLTPLTMAVNLFNAAIVVAVFWGDGPRPALAGWFALISLLAGAALRAWWTGRRRGPHEAASRRATRRTLVHAAVLAVAWGLAPAALLPAADPFERFVLGCLATGMIAGGAFALSAVPGAGLAYTWLLCLLTGAGMAASGDPAMLAASGFLCFYAAVISRNLVAHGELFAANLRGRFEIEAQRAVLGLLLRDFEESAAHCLWETDAAGRLHRCPARFARMLGLSPEAAEGAPLPALLGPGGGLAARFAARDAFAELLAEAPTGGGEAPRVLSLTAKPVLDADGAFAGYRGVASDVTERVRAEADLARTRAFLDAVVENVPAVLFAKDMADGGRYVLLNRAGERLLGCRRAEVVGRTDRELFPPEEAERFAANDRRAMDAAACAADDPAARFVLEEAALAARDGGVRHLRTTKLALVDAARGAAGPPRYLLGISEDVTERKRDEENLREQHRRLDAALANMSHGLAMFDAEGRLLVCNRRLLEMHGVPDGLGAPGTPLRAMVEASVALGNHPGLSADEIVADCRARVAGTQPSTALARLADGRTVAMSFQPLAGGGSVVTFEDVTERRRSEALIRQQHERFDAALSNMSQGLCMFDAETRLVVHNQRFLDLFGLPPGAVRPGLTHREVVGRIAALGRYAPGPSVEGMCADTLAVVAGRATASAFDRALADGRTLAIATRPTAGGGWVSTFDDVTERRRAEARIAHMARHDALTGLPNRPFFHECLERLLDGLRRGGPADRGGAGDDGRGVAVLWIDLDRFKHVNDTLGHPTGDALLKAVAGRIAAATRSPRGKGGDEGATVARLGGDEFAVALPVGGDGRDARAEATALAARIAAALGESFGIDGHQVAAGASVGVALAPADGDRPDRLLKAADLALYRAKAEGRGTFRAFEPEMGRRAEARGAMEADLRRALAAGEFELHYQPLLDLRADRVSGFEALLRWNHPGRGRVPPAEFIPVAEELGLIGPIGDWALRAACAEAATWPGGLKVAVNLSPAQFRSGALVSSVAEALEASGLPPGRLELEITETVLLECSESNAEQLRGLRALGARLALDDFGTGYSSLSHLRAFPFDKIKIDRSFVRDLERDGEGGCAAIVRAVAGLGASLGVRTTAEGVETAAQLAFVRAEGCTEVQGYHVSPPLPAAEIAALLRSPVRLVARGVPAAAG